MIIPRTVNFSPCISSQIFHLFLRHSTSYHRRQNGTRLDTTTSENHFSKKKIEDLIYFLTNLLIIKINISAPLLLSRQRVASVIYSTPPPQSQSTDDLTRRDSLNHSPVIFMSYLCYCIAEWNVWATAAAIPIHNHNNNNNQQHRHRQQRRHWNPLHRSYLHNNHRHHSLHAERWTY